MAEITYSNDQLSVIESRDENVLVSAAAGSGKTAVLVERIIRRITEDPKSGHPVDIDRLLVVTFTNAAAREMKERIMQALDKKLMEDPSNAHLAKQATLVHNAKIMTIDSFCLYLVKNHFHKLDLDPSFRIAAEGEIKLIKEDVMNQVINRAYQSENEDFFRLVDSYSGKENDDNIKKFIIDLFNFAMSYPWPAKWIEEHRKDYSFESEEKFLQSDLVKELLLVEGKELKKCLKYLNRAEKVCLSGPVEYLKSVSEDKRVVTEALQAVDNADYLKVLDVFNSWSKVRLPGKASGNEDDKAEFAALRKKWKDILDKFTGRFYPTSLEEMVADLNFIGRDVNVLFDLLTDFMESFDAAKRQRGIIDFGDMEHMAINILIDKYISENEYEISDVAAGYREYFEEVMVDEYQDANLVQEILLRSVSREDSDSRNNRFMVGDVKQSIYKFRLARPQIFMNKLSGYESKEKPCNRLITLKENYRSRKSVIDSVNAIFENIMTEEYEGTGYDDNQRLYAKASYPFEDSEINKTELLLIDKDEEGDTERFEALAIARKIKALHNTMPVMDKESKGARPAKYSDFAVLFRSQGSHTRTLCEVFDEYKIPYHLTGSGMFYSTREISEVLNFLKVINNPLGDIDLYGLMVSPFGNFSDEECSIISAYIEADAYYFWDKLTAYARDKQDEKCISFVNMINDYRRRSVYTPIAKLISQILDESNYFLYVAALPDGAQRLANVKLLVAKAAEYAQTSFHGLFHFLRYIELMKKISVDEGEADVFDENSDTVRIMTIHKSKGLEFPICFVMSMNKKFNNDDIKDPIIKDIDRGIGLKYIDPVRRIKRDTIIRTYITDKLAAELLAEEIRVLYVALTRAREKLIMTAITKEAPSFMEKAVSEDGRGNFLALIASSIAKNPDLFNVEVVSDLDMAIEEVKDEVSLSSLREEFEKEAESDDQIKIADKLRDKFAYEYPFKNLEKLYTKTTVSELKMAAMEDNEGESHRAFESKEDEAPVPQFASGQQKVPGTKRGTAYHEILFHTDFANRPLSIKEIKDSVTGMINRENIPKEYEELISFGKMLKFMQSDLAARMQRASNEGKLFKETPFVLGIEADRLDKQFPGEETVLIQGVIDVFFEEDEDIILMDYKTDKVEKGQELIERYKTQLDYYTEALERLTGKKVKEKLIYSFGLNEVIVVE